MACEMACEMACGERVVVVERGEGGELCSSLGALAAARLVGPRVVDVAGIHGPGSSTKFSG